MSDDGSDVPSKSQRKRSAHALQALGESLIELSDAELARVPMPERLREAVLDARRMRSRGALRRQRQLIGKVMRDTEPEPIRDALAQLRARARLDKRRLHEAERWRDLLIERGDAALGELLAQFPDADRPHLRRLVRDAQSEREQQRAPKAARVLFRSLRELLSQD